MGNDKKSAYEVLDAATRQAINALGHLNDPLARALSTEIAVRRAMTIPQELAHVRTEAVRELRAGGWSLQQIADELGVSRGRVQQIAKGPDTKLTAGE